MNEKAKHRAKVKLARIMATKIVDGKPRIVTVKGYGIFGTVAWEMRRTNIANKVHNREVQAHYRKLAGEDVKYKASQVTNE